MLMLMINRTRTGLSAAQYGELAQRAKAFYASIPPGVTLRGEWAAADRTRNFTLLEAPDLASVQAIAAPFAEFVEMEIVPVEQLSGWTVS